VKEEITDRECTFLNEKTLDTVEVKRIDAAMAKMN